MKCEPKFGTGIVFPKRVEISARRLSKVRGVCLQILLVGGCKFREDPVQKEISFKCKCFCPSWCSRSSSATADLPNGAIHSPSEFTPTVSVIRSIFSRRSPVPVLWPESGMILRTCLFLHRYHWSGLPISHGDISHFMTVIRPPDRTGRNTSGFLTSSEK